MEGRGLLVLWIHHHHWLYFSTKKKKRIFNRIVTPIVTSQQDHSDILVDEIQEQGRTECHRFVIAMEQEGHEIWQL